jgi:hypothetical protein
MPSVSDQPSLSIQRPLSIQPSVSFNVAYTISFAPPSVQCHLYYHQFHSNFLSLHIHHWSQSRFNATFDVNSTVSSTSLLQSVSLLLPSVSLPLPRSSHTPLVLIPFQLNFQCCSHHQITDSSQSSNAHGAPHRHLAQRTLLTLHGGRHPASSPGAELFTFVTFGCGEAC